MAEIPFELTFVELGSSNNPELAPQTVAVALGIPERADELLQDRLLEFIGRRFLLLVLDNC